jgi:hypothetical protein
MHTLLKMSALEQWSYWSCCYCTSFVCVQFKTFHILQLAVINSFMYAFVCIQGTDMVWSPFMAEHHGSYSVALLGSQCVV